MLPMIVVLLAAFAYLTWATVRLAKQKRWAQAVVTSVMGLVLIAFVAVAGNIELVDGRIRWRTD
jgi:uncharacterized membrane protein